LLDELKQSLGHGLWLAPSRGPSCLAARSPQFYDSEARVRDWVEPGFDDARTFVAALDLVLQQHQPIQNRLRAGRTAGDVHVTRDDLVDARYARVVVVKAAARRAGAER